MKEPGHTKIQRLTMIEKLLKINNKLFAKIENSNPSGSIKDRPVYYILNILKEKGFFDKETTIVEATSGNTGISLSYYANVFHYRAIIVMPKTMSKERQKMITDYGAKLRLIDGGMKECENECLLIKQSVDNCIIFDQFNNLNNPLSHYLTTGNEIIKECKDINYLFAGIGTGGTISGIGKRLKQYNKSIKIIGVEPKESPLLTKGECGAHFIQGIGANFVPKTLDMNFVDDVVDVDSHKSIEMARLIRKEEKLDVGISSGAALLAAINYIQTNKIHDQNIVIIFPDKGDRYEW